MKSNCKIIPSFVAPGSKQFGTYAANSGIFTKPCSLNSPANKDELPFELDAFPVDRIIPLFIPNCEFA